MSDDRLARVNALLSHRPRPPIAPRIAPGTRASRMVFTPALTALLTLIGAVAGLAAGDPCAFATVGCCLGIFTGFLLVATRPQLHPGPRGRVS